jgi:hypothetical protein
MTRLNGISPYFTMFPLDFPFGILQRYARDGDWVLDPFCGRGTTNYAARLLGLPSVGIDSNPVAAASAAAKLVNVSPSAIVRAAEEILETVAEPRIVPQGEFWQWAFHADTLSLICRLREGISADCRSDARTALRAIILGALHGPRPKSRPAYFSNQAQRTYAPKPNYAVKFWKDRNLAPEAVDVIRIIEERAHRFYGSETTTARGSIRLGDSRCPGAFADCPDVGFTWVITSPPYFGMRTYLPDQWLRLWFLGGPDRVEYSQDGQIEHRGPVRFIEELRHVWNLVGDVSAVGAHLVVRFGGINDRKVDPMVLLNESLKETRWVIDGCETAGSSAKGRRQALHFAHCRSQPIEEHDLWTTLRG